MKETNSNIFELLRRALHSQIDLGFDEVIVERMASAGGAEVAAEEELVRPEKVRVVPVADFFGGSSDSIISEQAEYGSLEEHKRAIEHCQKCPLWQSRNKFVYGAGSPHAKLMFIGEAPGAEEDRIGEPFVGRAGQLLDKILAAIQLSRETVYIANILKSRPPNNRDPLPEEMTVCMPYLLEQIRIIKPRLLCALGRISAQALLETSAPLGKLRKKWHVFRGIPLLVTYHPAALLRFPAYKRDTWEDMQMLKARYDELT